MRGISKLWKTRPTFKHLRAVWVAAMVGILAMQLWPDLVGLISSIGVERFIAMVVIVQTMRWLYQWLYRRSAPSEQLAGRTGAMATGNAVLSGAVPSPLRNMESKIVQSRLVNEGCDPLVVSTALARAVHPTDLEEVRQLVDALKATDQRSPDTGPSAAARNSVERRARHEAGHAVVVLATGGSIVEAEVREEVRNGRSFGGRVESTWPLADLAVQRWADLQTALAGQVIDRVVGIRDGGSSADVRLTEEHAEYFVSAALRPPGYTGDMTTIAIVAAATVAVEQLLDEHADAVSRIAEALVVAAADARSLRDPDLRPLFAGAV